MALSPEEDEIRLTRNWGRAKTRLSDFGVDLALVYKYEFNHVLSGGLRQKSESLGNLDLRISFDFEKIAIWKSGSAFAYFLTDHGGDPLANVGDAQVNSNGPNPLQAVNRGIYFLAEQSLTHWVFAFFRCGAASSAVILVKSFLSSGFVRGGVPHRSKDRVGFADARANTGAVSSMMLVLRTVWRPSARSGPMKPIDRVEVIPGVAIQPDFQWVVHPGFSPLITDVKVFATRAELNL